MRRGNRRSDNNENTKPDLTKELLLRMGSRCLGQTGRRLPEQELSKHRDAIRGFVSAKNMDGGIEYVENQDFTYILF